MKYLYKKIPGKKTQLGNKLGNVQPLHNAHFLDGF